MQIIEEFFEKHTSYTKDQDKTDLLFRFVQYVERQVVLFDALEDAAFREVNDMSGIGTLKHPSRRLYRPVNRTSWPKSSTILPFAWY